MRDENTSGEAALAALGLHGEADARTFARECERNPEATAERAAMEDIAALMATASCEPAMPPASCLEGALAKISPQKAHRRTRKPLPLGWAAAALLAVSTAWFATRSTLNSREISRLTAITDETGTSASRPESTEVGTPTLVTNNQENTNTPTGEDSLPVTSRVRTLTLVQDIDRLKREIKALRAKEESRLTPTPGVSRTLVVEMTDPDATPVGDDSESITESVTDILVEGIASEFAPASEDIGDTSSQISPDLTAIDLSDPAIAPALSRGERVLVTLPDNIGTFSGYTPLPGGGIYDENNGSPVFWIPTDSPGSYLSAPVPDGFLPDFASDLQDLIPEPFRLAPDPVPEPPPTVTPDAVTTPNVADDAPLRMAVLFEESTGEGTLITPNFAPESPVIIEAQDSLTGESIVVGMLPTMVDPVETIDFIIPGRVSLENFTLRFQNPDGSPGDIIATGPQPANP